MSMKPKIRFKGFDGDWENYVLSNIAKFSRGKGYSKSDLKDSGTPIILYGRMYTNYQSSIEKVNTFSVPLPNSLLSKGNEIIIPGSGETAEDIACAAVVKQKGVIIGGDLNVISLSEDFNSDFTALSLTYGRSKIELVKRAQGKTVVHLHNSEIARACILYPHDKQEQQSIAYFFQTIDAQISSSVSRLASLKQIRVASLQTMFPQEGETVPRLRFKGFEGEWKKVLLSECVTIHNEQNINNEFNINDVLSVSDDYGICNQIKLLGRSFAGKSVKNYGIVHPGDIVYTKSPLKLKPYGIIKVNHGKVGIVSVLYAIYVPNENISSTFIEQYFELAERLNKYIRPLVNKGAKNTMNISDETALQGSIMIPKYEEQQLIASYFTSLNRQIILQSQRLEKLKQIKAACLDKMFI